MSDLKQVSQLQTCLFTQLSTQTNSKVYVQNVYTLNIKN